MYDAINIKFDTQTSHGKNHRNGFGQKYLKVCESCWTFSQYCGFIDRCNNLNVYVWFLTEVGV